MAYNTLFYSVATDDLTNQRISYPEIIKANSPVGTCSHYMAGHPVMRELLDDGHPLDGATHRFINPHYRLPEELPRIINTLEVLLKTDFKDDEWSTNEVKGFIQACQIAKKSSHSLLVTYSHP